MPRVTGWRRSGATLTRKFFPQKLLYSFRSTSKRLFHRWGELMGTATWCVLHGELRKAQQVNASLWAQNFATFPHAARRVFV